MIKTRAFDIAELLDTPDDVQAFLNEAAQGALLTSYAPWALLHAQRV